MVSTTQREQSDRCGVAPTTVKSASEMLIDTCYHIISHRSNRFIRWDYLTAARSEGTKAEASAEAYSQG